MATCSTEPKAAVCYRVRTRGVVRAGLRLTELMAVLLHISTYCLLLTAYYSLLTTDCYEVYPLGVRAHGQRPDAETERDLRLLFGDGLKELHAEVPPEPGAEPLLLLALALALALTLTPK